MGSLLDSYWSILKTWGQIPKVLDFKLSPAAPRQCNLVPQATLSYMLNPRNMSCLVYMPHKQIPSVRSETRMCVCSHQIGRPVQRNVWWLCPHHKAGPLPMYHHGGGFMYCVLKRTGRQLPSGIRGAALRVQFMVLRVPILSFCIFKPTLLDIF